MSALGRKQSVLADRFRPTAAGQDEDGSRPKADANTTLLAAKRSLREYPRYPVELLPHCPTRTKSSVHFGKLTGAITAVDR